MRACLVSRFELGLWWAGVARLGVLALCVSAVDASRLVFFLWLVVNPPGVAVSKAGGFYIFNFLVCFFAGGCVEENGGDRCRKARLGEETGGLV